MSIRITKLHLALFFTAVFLTVFFFNRPYIKFSLENICIPLSIRSCAPMQDIVPKKIEPIKQIDSSHEAQEIIAQAGEEMKIAIAAGKDVAQGQLVLRQAKKLATESRFVEAIASAEQSVRVFKHAPLRLLSMYMVKRGDNLWNISKRPEVYGRGAHWVKVWRANEKKIPDFDIICSKQKLVIPR